MKKPDRHLYSITEAGKEFFHDTLRQFPEELAGNDNEFYNRLAFFELLDPQTQHNVLSFRMNYIREQLSTLEDTATYFSGAFSPYSPQLLAFFHDRFHQELAFLETLARETGAQE